MIVLPLMPHTGLLTQTQHVFRSWITLAELRMINLKLYVFQVGFFTMSAISERGAR